MGEHKRNPNIAEARPKCGTCVHYFRDAPPAQGHCRRLPPSVFHLMGRGPLGQAVPVLQSNWPPVTTAHYCGEHPDFLPWYMEYRRSGLVEALDTVKTEGAA